MSVSPLRSSLHLLLAARTVSRFGSAIAPVALTVAVLDHGGIAGDLGVILAVRVVVQIAFLLLGGVVADRVRRQRVMLWAELASGCAQLASAAVVSTSGASVVALAALQATGGAADAFFMPAS